MVRFTGAFAYECDKCAFGGERDTLRAAFTTVQEHRQSELHEVLWTQFNFDPPLESALGPEWKVECKNCYQSWRHDSKQAAEEFADQHAKVVGHEIDSITEYEDAALETESVKGALERLTPEFDRGVPKPVLLHLLEQGGFTSEEIDREIQRLSKRGDVYQPSDRLYRYISDS
ncbi:MULTISPECIES: hypothetical protein [Halorussus]|uniref:hypothetical protein n=1 Tax=Halorussus TaxID=1070314 RepID=UPI0020A0AD9E|nr:hypothetical protein [Halorussus vallis]USZ78732.1 hypothetical protein NGM07_24790 [Halorussus vallis]